MNYPNYVSRRMLLDVCDISTSIDPRGEPFYDTLFTWMEVFTTRFSTQLLSGLPPLRTSSLDLDKDMIDVYSSILRAVPDVHSVATLNCLFTVSFYMMVRYKETPVLSSNIANGFELISRTLRGWQLLEEYVGRECARRAHLPTPINNMEDLY